MDMSPEKLPFQIIALTSLTEFPRQCCTLVSSHLCSEQCQKVQASEEDWCCAKLTRQTDKILIILSFHSTNNSNAICDFVYSVQILYLFTLILCVLRMVSSDNVKKSHDMQ